MEENDLQLNNDNNNNNSLEKDEKLKPRKNSRIWLYIITATCGILVIGGIVFAIMYFANQNQGQ